MIADCTAEDETLGRHITASAPVASTLTASCPRPPIPWPLVSHPPLLRNLVLRPPFHGLRSHGLCSQYLDSHVLRLHGLGFHSLWSCGTQPHGIHYRGLWSLSFSSRALGSDGITSLLMSTLLAWPPLLCLLVPRPRLLQPWIVRFLFQRIHLQTHKMTTA